MAANALDGSLDEWPAIAGRYDRAILTGNGASLAVSNRFSYRSLYGESKLSAQDRAVFGALETTNFELVLDALRVARVVCSEAGHKSRTIYDQARRVRRALVDTVARVHVPWTDVPHSTLTEIREGLRHYEYVFTTNYDLLHYWAIMSDDARGFRDFFWGPGTTFDAADVGAWASMTKILYVHGALHLFRDDLGRARKRTSASRNLLDAFSSASDVPLFVSEGRSAEKLAAIRRSDYLTFAYETFARECSSLVVFGHSLGNEDAHLRHVIARSAQKIAVGLRPGSRSDVRQRKAHVISLFPKPRIDFFNSESHPLGRLSLGVST